MKEKIIYSVLLIAAIIFITNNLHAFGIGAYFTASKGPYEWEYNIDETEDPVVDSKVRKLGFGLMLDTNLAYYRLFNYRLQVGYSSIKIANDHNAYDISGKDYHTYSSFGFGLIRGKYARLWVGPQLGMGFITGQYELPSSLAHEDNYFWTLYFSLGAVAGINYNPGDVFTLAFDGGFRANAGFGTAEMATTDIGVQETGSEAFVNIYAVFRLNE